MIGMKTGDEPVFFDAAIERIALEVPRFIVYPGKAWDETGTFLVDVSLSGIPIGLRNLIPWKERGWHFGLSQPMCRKVGVERIMCWRTAGLCAVHRGCQETGDTHASCKTAP
jgi:hypothetical protein